MSLSDAFLLNFSVGVNGDDCGTLLIDNNVVALNSDAPIQFYQAAMVSGVNNLTPQGVLIQPYDKSVARLAEAYFPVAEEAFILAI